MTRPFSIHRGKRFLQIRLGSLHIYFSLTPLSPKHRSATKRSFRRRILREQPVCAHCGCTLDITTLSIHHHIPVYQRPDLVYDPANCLALCRRCHVNHHRRQDSLHAKSSPVLSVPVMSTPN